MTTESLDKILSEVIVDNRSLILAVLSSPKKPNESQKITLRPLLIKGEIIYQFTELRQQQALHKNFSPQEAKRLLEEHLKNFKQAFLYTSQADYQILSGKKGHQTILKKAPSKSPLALSHNRPKNYLLEEGIPVPFLIELGIMNREGRVHAQKMDKFRQINRFLEMVDDVVSHLNVDRPLHVIDFGCGKAYLTFALYHYLKLVKGYNLHLVGLDLKQDVIEKCQQLAQALNYQDLHFALGDINAYKASHPVEMVVSLHACDTATDAALEKAIRWQADVILCVPCCQHELFKQVHNDALEPILKHGILKERFSALATDAARAQLLESLGYQTQLLEFIDLEHTPKNLLIRAIKRTPFSPGPASEAWHAYKRFKEHLQINPSLERRFKEELSD